MLPKIHIEINIISPFDLTYLNRRYTNKELLFIHKYK